jgi:hypothetical protein
MDIAKIQDFKDGWVACEFAENLPTCSSAAELNLLEPGTSDAIFRDRPQLWDLLVDLGSTSVTVAKHNDPGSQSTEMSIPSMRARYVPEGETTRTPRPPVTTKPITHTFSDEALWKEIQAVSTRSDENDFESIPREDAAIATGLWGYAYGAYSTLCDVCWGVCALAVGLGGSKARDGHAHAAGTGYIRLPPDGEDQMDIEDDDEDDQVHDTITSTPKEDAMYATRQVLAIFQRRDRQLIRQVELLGDKKTLSKDDMSALGLSTWSWVDVDFVRAMYAQVKRDRLARAQNLEGPSHIQVERGWFRWVSSIVGA